MNQIESLKSKVKSEVDLLLLRLVEISDAIGLHPELGSEEIESSNILASELEKHGFIIEKGVLNMPTAFKAIFKGKSGGPIIAFLSEYDALPGVGHGCGHNIIGTIGIGAGIAISKLLEDLEGEVWVVGTPAEEGRGPSRGAKKVMAEAGLFDKVDAVMMVHPMGSPISTVASGFLATSGVSIEFQGKTSHAAADPQSGVNALNAAVLCYMAIHANRQQLRRDANAVVHGIITEGGLASNIIPDRATLQFGVRSSDDSYIPTLIDMVIRSAKGTALATGCEVVTKINTGLKSNLRNKTLERLFVKQFEELKIPVENPDVTASRIPGGSTDFTDLSHHVPGMHVMLGISEDIITMHSKEFAAHTLTQKGHEGIMVGTKILAMSGVEILLNPTLREEITSDHKKYIG